MSATFQKYEPDGFADNVIFVFHKQPRKKNVDYQITLLVTILELVGVDACKHVFAGFEKIS